MSIADIVQRGWDAIGAGNFDALVDDYVEEMTFIMPGQADILEGRQAFRAALNGLGEDSPARIRNHGTTSDRGQKRSRLNR